MQRARGNKPAPVPQRRKLHERYKRSLEGYETTARRVTQRLQQLMAKEGINGGVKRRVKSFESYFGKVLRLREEDASQVSLTDFLGFRIICPFLSDLEDVERLLKANFRVVEVEVKGAEHSFREFGYDSTHLLINLKDDMPRETVPYARPVGEVQLRTILQDAWAEVEHEIIYKSDYSLLHEPIKRKLASLNATLTLSDVIFQEIRDYQNEVRQRDTRRRTSVEEQMQPLEPVSILEDPGGASVQGPDDAPPIPVQHGTEIDRLIFQALAAHGKGDLVTAVQAYSRVLRMKSNRHVRAVIYNHRGMAYFVLAQYQRAVKDFSNAIRYDAESFRAYNNRALTYRILHQYERALHDLDRSLEINAVQSEGYYVRALTHFDLHDLSKAIQDCERVLNIRPDFVAVQHLKTLIASKLGR